MIEALLGRLMRGTVWSVAATGLSSAFNLLASVMCAHYLGSAAFGQLGVLQSTVGFVALLAVLGLGTTATRFVSRHLRDEPLLCGRMLGGVLTIGGITILVASILLYVSARSIGSLWLRSADLEAYVRLCSLWLVSFAADELLMAALAGLEAFRAVAQQSLLRGALVLVGVTIGLRWGLQGALVGWSVGLAASSIVVARVLMQQCRFHGVRIARLQSAVELRSILSYAVPTLLSGLAYTPFVWFTNTMVVRSSGGFEQMAVLAAVYQWRGVMTYLPVSLSRVVLPMLSAAESGDSSSSGNAFAISNLVNLVVVITCGIVLLGLSGLLMGVFGASYAQGREAFVLVLGGTMVGYVGFSLGSLIQARGLFRLGIAGNLLSGVGLLLCTFFFVGRYGAVAVGYGTLLGFFLNLTFCCVGLIWGGLVPRKLGLRIFATGLCCAILVLGFAHLSPTWSAICAMPVLTVALVLLYHVFARPAGLTVSAILETMRTTGAKMAI